MDKAPYRISKKNDFYEINADERINFAGNNRYQVDKLTHYLVSGSIQGVFDTGEHLVSDELAAIFDALEFSRL